MAIRYVNPYASSNGDGLSWGSAYDLTAFDTNLGGSHTYLTGPGLIRKTITFGSSNAKLIGLDPYNMPVVDCENTRVTGINLNGASGNEVAWFKIINQDAVAPNAAVRVTGSAHHLHHLHTSNARHGIHLNGSANNVLEYNFVDVGNTISPTQGWGIRLNNSSCIGNKIRHNRFVSTRATPNLYVDGSMFGVCVELSGAVLTDVGWNIMTAAMCDQFIARVLTDQTKLHHNLCYGTGMLDGMDILNSTTADVYCNTVIHPGDVTGHAGPCMAVGDDYGVGVASTNVTLRNNLFWANNRLCLSIRPIGAGFSSSGNRLYRTNGIGDAVVNLNEGAGFIATNFGSWLAKEYVTDDTYGDPIVTNTGHPLAGSPLFNSGIDLGYLRDMEDKQARNFIGAYAAATLRGI